MTIRQLQKVLDLDDNQRVRVNDGRKLITIESVEGWVFEPEYEYDGFNYEEVERIMSLKITGMKFNRNWLTIWTA